MTVADTSIAAFNKISETLGRRQRQVLRCIRSNEPITNLEISNILNIPINSITGRSSELREKGLIEQYGTKRINGFNAKSWMVVHPLELF